MFDPQLKIIKFIGSVEQVYQFYSKKIYNLHHKKKYLQEENSEDKITENSEEKIIENSEDNSEDNSEENFHILENKILIVSDKDNEKDVDINNNLFSDDEM